MTPPTIHEFAGIFMLALVAAGLIAHPSTGSHAATAPLVAISTDTANTVLIDGVEPVALPTARTVAETGQR